MKFYSVSLPDVRPIKIVTAKSTYGVGFLTRIVGGFCNLFGIPCNMYTKKIEKAEALAMERLEKSAKELKADGVMDLRCQIDGLSFFACGTAYKSSNEMYKDKAKKEPKRKKDLLENAFDEENKETEKEGGYVHIVCPSCNERLSFLKDEPNKVCPWCNAEVVRKKPISIPDMEKPADFVCRSSWKQDIMELPTDEVYERYLDKERWNESYRYLCYLELKERGN